MTAVDVIIATRGRGALIDVTIASTRQSTYRGFCLWIVDQITDDATERAFAPHVAEDSRVHYQRSISQGVDIGRNDGVAAGSAPYLLFTDDGRAEPDWLGTMLSELEQDGTWAVFGRVVPDDTFRPELADGKALARDKPVSRALPVALKDEPQRKVYQGSCLDLGFGHRANMGLRRACFDERGGFNELLGAGAPLRSWPQRDLDYPILRRGGRIIHTPAALVHQRHWRRWSEVRRTSRDYAIGAGAATGKHLRCGDWAGLCLPVEWLAGQGVRQVVSGVLNWRSGQKIQVGLLQLIYPWVGLIQGWRHPVDCERALYRRS